MKQIVGPPQKCYVYERDKITFPNHAQVKLNGLRARYVGRHFLSGDASKDKMWNDEVVAHLLEPLSKLSKSVKLDGEFYWHGHALQDINSAIGVVRLLPTINTPCIKYHVFDAIEPRINFDARMSLASNAVRDVNHPSIVFAITSLIKNHKEADEFYRYSLEEGYEGAVYRMKYGLIRKKPVYDTGYVGDYVPWMLKRKASKDAEFKVVGIEEGKETDKGSRLVGTMGALVCVTKKGVTFNCGGGFSDKERDAHWKRPPLGKLLRIEFRELSKDGVPQEPRSLGIRDYEID